MTDLTETYYVTATGKKGEQKLITNLIGSRASAENAARAHCKREGLNFENILTVKGSVYSGTPQHKSLFKRIAAERSKK